MAFNVKAVVSQSFPNSSVGCTVAFINVRVFSVSSSFKMSLEKTFLHRFQRMYTIFQGEL